MRVTVIGSYKEDMLLQSHVSLENAPVITKRFYDACRAIGYTLAINGHRLVVAHSHISEAAEAPTLDGFKSHPPATFRYKTCPLHQGDPALKAHLDAVKMSDVIILIGGGNATLASGLDSLRRHRIIIRIPGFGGSAKDLFDIPEIDDLVTDEIRNLDFLAEETDFDPNWEIILTKSIENILNQYPKLLIIHGRGDKGEELKNKIISESISPFYDNHEKNSLYGLARPFIMNLSGSGSVIITAVFEELASRVTAAIVIVTADDIGSFARKPESSEIIPATELQFQMRARENVWIELGWFWGRLGRKNLFLWFKDNVEIPSDIQGVARTENNELEHAWKSIRTFIEGIRFGNPTSFEE